MRLFGLIGYPLGHSFSKKYFTEKFISESITETYYELFPIENIEKFPDLILKKKNLLGLNVTIPYKEQIIQFLDDIDLSAKKIGAVNCVKIKKGKTSDKLIGYNTDVYGFEKSFLPFLQKHHTKALILGTGGASKAVEFVLKKLNIDYMYVSRTPKSKKIIGYNDLDKDVLSNYPIIINTSPLGMFPNVNSAPAIPFKFLNSKHLLYDLVYNPEETKFMALGRDYSATVSNGLSMLHEQAEKAWEIWNSQV